MELFILPFVISTSVFFIVAIGSWIASDHPDAGEGNLLRWTGFICIAISITMMIWYSNTETSVEYIDAQRISNEAGIEVLYYEFNGERVLLKPIYTKDVVVKVKIPRKGSVNMPVFEVVSK